jgi:hypothetical protein
LIYGKVIAEKDLSKEDTTVEDARQENPTSPPAFQKRQKKTVKGEGVTFDD